MSIPICPHCKIPTMREELSSSSTLMYFPPVYNEKGININPDRNTTTTDYRCLTCNNIFNDKQREV